MIFLIPPFPYSYSEIGIPASSTEVTMSVWKGMVLFEDPKLFGRPTLLDTDASIVAVEKVDAELLSTCLSDLSDPIILRSVSEEATSGGCRSPIRLEFSWPYGYVKLAHHIRKKLAPSARSYLAADTSSGGSLLTLVVELPEELGTRTVSAWAG